MAVFCKHGNKPSGFIKGGESLEQLRCYYYLLKKSSAPWSPLYLSDTFHSFPGILTLTHFNPLKPKIVKIIFKNSVRTSKRNLHLTITKITGYCCLKKMAVYIENHNKHTIIKIVKIAGTNNYQETLKG
jgi:hypothetical protein